MSARAKSSLDPAEPGAARGIHPSGASGGAEGRVAGIGRVLEHQLIVARRMWRNILIVGVVTPLLYVLALGVGLGTVVNRHGSGQLGVPYLVFVAPAFLTAAAVQIAFSESAYPVLAGFKWLRTFHGIAATPLSPARICEGLLCWVTLRLAVNAAIYLAVVAALGGTQSWWVLLAVPAAVLTGVAFAAPVMAIAASITNEGQVFNVIVRFVVTPMFLFSGTFYPISRLPEWGRWLAYVSPLWHGTELSRDAAIGGRSALSVLGHIGYLLVWLVVGTVLARRRFRVRLEK